MCAAEISAAEIHGNYHLQRWATFSHTWAFEGRIMMNLFATVDHYENNLYHRTDFCSFLLKILILLQNCNSILPFYSGCDFVFLDGAWRKLILAEVCITPNYSRGEAVQYVEKSLAHY